MSLMSLFLLVFMMACGEKKSDLKSSGNMSVHPSEVLSACIVLVMMSPKGGYCSGTLIDDPLNETSALVLTAAHCVESDNREGKNHYFIRLGHKPAYLNSEEKAYQEKIEVADYITTPTIPYVKLQFLVGSDLALLRLKHRPKLPQKYFLQLIKGSDKDLKYDQVWVSGYGYHYPGITLKKYPRKVFSYTNVLNLIWISSLLGNIIPGDSGGPLLVRNKDGHYEVLGVNSFGTVLFGKAPLSLSAVVDVRTKEPWLICAKEFLKTKEVKTNDHCQSRDFKYVAMD